MAQAHDTAYKQLFSHPDMVRDLLRAFVPGTWVGDADFSTLTAVPASFVSDSNAPTQRHADLVWKLRLRSSWVYVYLMLEFQSRPDRLMALRMLVNQGLLYQALAREGHSGEQVKLPPVLPVVLYNGEALWQAPLALEDLLAAPADGLEQFLPRSRYVLLDAQRLALHQSWPVRNLAAALFRLESRRTPDDMRQVVEALLEWLDEETQDALRRAFAHWIKHLLRAHMPAAEFDHVSALQEIRIMLADRIDEWFREAAAKGEREGLRRGFSQGIQEGRQKGRQEGRQEGLQKGLQEGLQEGLGLGQREGQLLSLERILCKRFGPVPAHIKARWQAADLAQIGVWIDRSIDAASLDAVFGPSEAGPH